MEINSHILHVKGKAELMGPIERNQAYKIMAEGSITNVHEPDNENGTCDRVYDFTISRAEVMDNLGKVTKTHDARKAHVKLRAVLRREWDESQTDVDEETHYQRRMAEIMSAIINGKV